MKINEQRLSNLAAAYRMSAHHDQALAAPPTLEEVSILATAAVKARKDVKLMATRLQILTGRMRACREETGRHDLLPEAEAFVEEADAVVKEMEA